MGKKQSAVRWLFAPMGEGKRIRYFGDGKHYWENTITKKLSGINETGISSFDRRGLYSGRSYQKF